MGKRWSCKPTAKRLMEQARQGVEDLKKQGVFPHLAVVVVGEIPASQVYVGKKTQACEELGIVSTCIRMPDTTDEATLLAQVEELNQRPDVHGILVQLPLPDGISTQKVINTIHPDKDVDGFHPVNVGRLSLGQQGLVPCTPQGVMELLTDSGLELKGKRAVVVGRSDIVGKPMVQLLLRQHATVTVMHSRTQNPAEVCREADLIVAAVGVPGLVRKEWIKTGAYVVDVGINEITDPDLAAPLLKPGSKKEANFESKGRMLYGDVHYFEALESADLVTPVPGGIGTLTIGQLMCNCIAATRLQLTER